MKKRTRLHRNRVGSNQHRTKHRFLNERGQRDILMLLIAVGAITAAMLYGRLDELKKHAELVIPVPQIYQVEAQETTEHQEPALAPIEEPKTTHIEEKTPTQQAIANEIRDVFGQDADKAFKLLSCENHSLNPNAVNHNHDSIHSSDYGVFQINNHWQGVSNVAFLTDYHINIRMAYNIYSRDHYSFKLWTCGRMLGI